MHSTEWKKHYHELDKIFVTSKSINRIEKGVTEFAKTFEKQPQIISLDFRKIYEINSCLDKMTLSMMRTIWKMLFKEL